MRRSIAAGSRAATSSSSTAATACSSTRSTRSPACWRRRASTTARWSRRSCSLACGGTRRAAACAPLTDRAAPPVGRLVRALRSRRIAQRVHQLLEPHVAQEMEDVRGGVTLGLHGKDQFAVQVAAGAERDELVAVPGQGLLRRRLGLRGVRSLNVFLAGGPGGRAGVVAV